MDKILLFPYYFTLLLKDFLYRKGILKQSVAEVPSICIGNITAGGTGKTPMAEKVLRTLLDSDEWAYSNIAVLSRGYKRKSRGFQKVGRGSHASLSGDEPLQIAGKFPSVTVAVDKDRIEGCRFLCHPDALGSEKKGRRCLDKDFPPADIIVLDDAFQYRKLKASVNIILVDYNRPLHKDRLLPFGRLRDLPSRIGEADMIIVTKCPNYMDEWEKGKWAVNLGVEGYSQVTGKGRSASGREQTLLFSTIGYLPMIPVFDEADSRYMYAKRLVLFTGIAKDTPLVRYLSDNYKIGRRLSFPDHHRYTRSDVRKIVSALKGAPTSVVVTTEKDAQRIVDVKGVPDQLKQRLFQIPIETRFLSVEDEGIFVTTLLSLLRGSRSGL